MEQAIKDQYLPDEDKDEATLLAEKKAMESDLFVTGKSGKKINVEMCGMDKS